MKVLKTHEADRAALELIGDFDAFCCPALAREIDGLLAAGVLHLELDLHRVSFLNSTAVGLLLRLARRLESARGSLSLAAPSRAVLQTLEALGLEERLLPRVA